MPAAVWDAEVAQYATNACPLVPNPHGDRGARPRYSRISGIVVWRKEFSAL